MLVLRCTQRLFKRIRQPDADPPQSTTVLGDRFAQPLLVGRQRFILLASEHSRLSILMPARDVKHLARNFPAALVDMLCRLGIPAAAIAREVDAAHEVVIAATNSRSVLGTQNDYSNIVEVDIA